MGESESCWAAGVEEASELWALTIVLNPLVLSF